jgi:hypothetical protein
MTELERNLQTYSPSTSSNSPHKREVLPMLIVILVSAVALSRENRARALELPETYPK